MRHNRPTGPFRSVTIETSLLVLWSSKRERYNRWLCLYTQIVRFLDNYLHSTHTTEQFRSLVLSCTPLVIPDSESSVHHSPRHCGTDLLFYFMYAQLSYRLSRKSAHNSNEKGCALNANAAHATYCVYRTSETLNPKNPSS